MDGPKYKVGQFLQTKEEKIDLTVIFIVNPHNEKTREYWCQAFPGAQTGYKYVECMNPFYLSISGGFSLVEGPHELSETMTLNIYRELDLEPSSTQVV